MTHNCSNHLLGRMDSRPIQFTLLFSTHIMNVRRVPWYSMYRCAFLIFKKTHPMRIIILWCVHTIGSSNIGDSLLQLYHEIGGNHEFYSQAWIMWDGAQMCVSELSNGCTDMHFILSDSTCLVKLLLQVYFIRMMQIDHKDPADSRQATFWSGLQIWFL